MGLSRKNPKELTLHLVAHVSPEFQPERSAIDILKQISPKAYGNKENARANIPAKDFPEIMTRLGISDA